MFLNAKNVSKKGFDFSETLFISEEKDNILRGGKLLRDDVILTTRGTVGNIAFFSNEIEYADVRINSGMIILRAKDNINAIYLYRLFKSDFMHQAIINYISGSAQPQLPIKDMKQIYILIPEKKIIEKSERFFRVIQKDIDLNYNQIIKLNQLKEILLSKMATIEG